jgi:transposase
MRDGGTSAPPRKRLDDRAALHGILFVLHTGIAWRHLPLGLGFGSGSTCYRRLDEWQRAGVWERLHALLLAELRVLVRSRGRARSRTPATCRGKRGSATSPSPVDRAGRGRSTTSSTRAGSPRLDAHRWQPPRRHPGDPSSFSVIPPARGRVGRPRRRPRQVAADRGCDHDAYRRELRRRRAAMTPRSACTETGGRRRRGRAVRAFGAPEPIVIQDGSVIESNLRRERMTPEEVAEEARQQQIDLLEQVKVGGSRAERQDQLHRLDACLRRRAGSPPRTRSL